MAEVKFYYGSSRPEAAEAYEGVIFFDTGTKQISRCYATGTSPAYAWENYGGEVVIGSSFPSYTTARQGVLYINSSTGAAKVYLGNGDNWATISSGALNPDTSISSSSTNTTVPSSLAVYTYVTSTMAANPSANPASGNSGKYVALDSNGLIPTAYIPSFALSEYLGAYESTSAMITAQGSNTSAQEGDYAVVTGDGTYILNDVSNRNSLENGWVKVSWADTDTQYSNATADSFGLVKPDGTTITISSGVISAVDTNSWRPFKVGNTTVNDKSTTVEFAGSGGTSVSYSNGTVTISSTAYSVAEASSSGVGGSNGLMSAADKEKLNGLSKLEWQTVSNS